MQVYNSVVIESEIVHTRPCLVLSTIPVSDIPYKIKEWCGAAQHTAPGNMTQPSSSEAYHVKERQVVLLNAEVRYLLPLFPGGVDAGGVVRAPCMQKRGLLQHLSTGASIGILHTQA